LNPNAVALDLFPELAVPEVVPKHRASKKSKTAVNPMGKKSVNNGLDASLNSAPVIADTGIANLETIAQQLEAHPDYRLLRRLKPRLDWPEPAPVGSEIARARTCIVVLDTETTGLDASKERIIELAMLKVVVDNATGLPVGPVTVYDELEDPGKPIPKEVVALTGISNADVAGRQLDEAKIAQMLDGVDLVIAHNAGFDRPFVESRLPAFAHLPWSCSFADIDWKAQGRSSAKLENLAQALGWFYDAHRAEMDCHALLAVLAVPLPQGPQSGLTKLLAAAQQPSFRLQATNAPFEAKDLLKTRGYRWNAEQRVWHTRLSSDASLQEELDWLKENVYQRSAVVNVETLDALTKYSSRAGKVAQRTL
jgi:DNA polymerase-3 subunit epsilon